MTICTARHGTGRQQQVAWLQRAQPSHSKLSQSDYRYVPPCELLLQLRIKRMRWYKLKATQVQRRRGVSVQSTVAGYTS
jgi:hypothetical protein